MIRFRKSSERGHFDLGWLNTYHSFSFGEYFDSEWHHFRHLRVVNEDFVAAGQGFGTHPHRDMEIVTYILSGSLEHKDSMGNGSIIKAGQVQRMTAGTGVTHSEFNPSPTEKTHLLQIWFFPKEKNLTPGYEQKDLPILAKDGWTLILSPEGKDGSVTVHQDVLGYVGTGKKLVYQNPAGRHAWIQVTRGAFEFGGGKLSQGDALAVSEKENLTFHGDGEMILFDLN